MLSNQDNIQNSSRRIFAVARRVLMQFWRDKKTLMMIFYMPVILMFIFGTTLSGDIKNIPISIEIADEGYIHPLTLEEVNFAENITEILKEDDAVSVDFLSHHEGVSQVDKGEIIAAIYFPQNFTFDIFLSKNTTIDIYIDSTKPQVKLTVYNAINEAIQEVFDDQGLDINEELAFGGIEYSGLDLSIPSVMGMILTFLILLLAGLTVTREEIGGTKQRLLTSPLTNIERLCGYAIALSVLTMVESIIVLIMGIFVFKTTVQGSIGLLFFASYLYGVAHIFFAFLLSNFAKNEFQSAQLAILVAVPSIAFSGIMIPVSSLPPIIATISKIVPLTYGIAIFEGIMLRGWGFKELWFEFALIFGLTIIFLIMTIISASKNLRD